MGRWGWVVLVLALLGPAGCGLGSDGKCTDGAGIPAPKVSSGTTEVTATAGVVQTCDPKYGMTHGDGPLVFGKEPVRLDAGGPVVIAVPDGLAMKAKWDGAAFTEQGDGTWKAPQPPDGCHRLRIELDDPDSENGGDFAVMVAVGDPDCRPPPPEQGFKLKGMTPTEAEVTVGDPVDVPVDIRVINPPDGYFCPRAKQVSGPPVKAEFPQGCTANGTGKATLRVQGFDAGKAVLEITAHAQDGTAATGSGQVEVTVLG